MKRPVVLAGMALLMAVFVPSPQELRADEVLDSICAVVDDEIILESDIIYGVNTLLLEQGVQRPTREQIQQMRDQVLDAYITQKVLLSKAHEETLRVEERAVNRELERKLDYLIQQVGSEQKLVEYFQRPLRRIRHEMRQGVEEGLLIEMLKSRRLAGLHVRRDEVISFYREHFEELPKLPERVELSHILLQVEPSPEALKQAYDRINHIRELYRQGADFDSLAREYSEDASAAAGGYIGFTDRGDLVPGYEEVAYALEPGEVSDVVRTRYGLHLIRLIERQGERISSQHILIKLAPTDEDRDRAMEQARELRRQIMAGADFAELAQRFSADSASAVKGGKMDPVALSDLPGEFSAAVADLDSGAVSKPFTTAYGIHLVRLDARRPERGLSLQEDWKIIEQFSLADKREREFRKWVESLKKDHYIWPPSSSS